MSKNSKRRQHCNKIKHHTLLAAQIALKKLVSSSKKRGSPIISKVSAYKCEYCSGWHVGTNRREINWSEVARVDEELKLRRSLCQKD